MWLVASSVIEDLAVVRDGRPALWRELRRFNAPIQLAVAAAHEVFAHAAAPPEAAIISVAPCHNGSPELHAWVREIVAGRASKINPTYTLHAVDNLALSVLSIAMKSRGWSMSLGGTMVYSALELALERDENEIVVLAGEQIDGTIESPATGIACLFSRERRPYLATGRATRLVRVDRQRHELGWTTLGITTFQLVELLAALRVAPAGELAFPGNDARDDVVVHWEVE